MGLGDANGAVAVTGFGLAAAVAAVAVTGFGLAAVTAAVAGFGLGLTATGNGFTTGDVAVGLLGVTTAFVAATTGLGLGEHSPVGLGTPGGCNSRVARVSFCAL